jgi:L,D-transpeptidase ErfK/SrfK
MVACSQGYATIYVLDAQTNAVGHARVAKSLPSETLAEAGRRYGCGYTEIVSANPNINPSEVLSANTLLSIPSRFMLPVTVRQGIVVDLAQYRLFYFPSDENVVYTFPVGIGRRGWNTPLGQTSILAKTENPSWTPTANIQKAAKDEGYFLPEKMPSSEYNPLGKYAMRLGFANILIHGSNQEEGIGRRVSAGCIRMLPDDIELLFSLVKIGTKVTIIDSSVTNRKQHQQHITP